jgi:hypothetical protein
MEIPEQHLSRFTVLANLLNSCNFPPQNIIKGLTQCTNTNEIYYRVPLQHMPEPIYVPEQKHSQSAVLMHGTTWAGIQGIFSSRRLTTTAWEDDGSGHHGIYAKGALLYQDAVQNVETIDNLAMKTASTTKNVCGIIIECVIRGKHTTLKSGGIEAEAETVQPTTATFTHMHREHRWCAHPDNIKIVALWLTADYTTTATMRQHHSTSSSSAGPTLTSTASSAGPAMTPTASSAGTSSRQHHSTRSRSMRQTSTASSAGPTPTSTASSTERVIVLPTHLEHLLQAYVQK